MKIKPKLNRVSQCYFVDKYGQVDYCGFQLHYNSDEVDIIVDDSGNLTMIGLDKKTFLELMSQLYDMVGDE